MNVFIPGQRWISESEPELGLGTIRQVTREHVQVEFPAAGETRTYAVDGAPLQRVRFRTGDKVRTKHDQEFIVQAVIEQQGLLIYEGAGQRWPEAELNDRLAAIPPPTRLRATALEGAARSPHLKTRDAHLALSTLNVSPAPSPSGASVPANLAPQVGTLALRRPPNFSLAPPKRGEGLRVRGA